MRGPTGQIEPGTFRVPTSKLLHRPDADPIVQSLVPIYNRDGSRVDLPDRDRGVPYSPNVIDTVTESSDGSVTLYFTKGAYGAP